MVDDLELFESMEFDEICWRCTPADAEDARICPDSIVDGLGAVDAAAAYESFDEGVEASVEGEPGLTPLLGS